jgi:phenylalanine-4-hydroxylase
MSLHLLARPHHPAAPASGMVWKMLFDRQQALLHGWASPALSSALVELGLRRDTLPNLAQISHLVQQRTGWTLLLTSAPVSETTYYAALRRRELPVVSRLRSFSEFDQPPGGPDLFADLFGRVPLLLEPGYTTALQALGAAWELATTPAAAALLRRFTRATFERGLLAPVAGGRPQFYGAQLLTSARHLHAAAAAEATTHQPLAEAVRKLSQPLPSETSLTAVGPEIYFVAESWADLAAAVQQLRSELIRMQLQALAGRPLPFTVVPPQAPGRGAAFAARIPGLWQAK